MTNNCVVFAYCSSNRNPEWGAALGIRDAIHHAAEHGIATKLYVTAGESLISRARQKALIQFMEGNADFTFSFDDDVTLPEDTITKLVQADKDIIGGIYRLKISKIATAVRLPHDGPKMEQVLEQELVTPAIYVSTGCFLVKRHVVESMIRHYPELEYRTLMDKKVCWGLYMPYIHNEEYLSEDWAFCQRAKDVGYSVWVHGGVKCGHWGKQLFVLP